MKKGICIAIVFFFCMILVGCGSKKTLSCTIDQSSELSGLGTMGAQIDADFNGSSLLEMRIKMNLEITSDKITESYMSTFKGIFDGVCKNGLASDIPLPNCDVKQNGKKLSLDATVKKSDIKNQKDTYGSVEKTKEEFEKMGYTCEIK